MGKNVFCVCVDAGGAHEADCVYSLWDNLVEAEQEAKRLNDKSRSDPSFSLGCYGGEAYIVTVELNSSRNKWIG